MVKKIIRSIKIIKDTIDNKRGDRKIMKVINSDEKNLILIYMCHLKSGDFIE